MDVRRECAGASANALFFKDHDQYGVVYATAALRQGRILAALLGANTTAQAALMQYTVEGRLTDDPNGTGIPSGTGFMFVYSLYSNAPYDPYFGSPRYRLHDARVEIPTLGFVGTWSESDFSSGLAGHVWVDNDVMWNPPDTVDAYIVDFDVSDPAGGFRFEWNAVDDDALMLTSDNLPQGAGFLAGADRFNVIFTLPLGQLGCADTGQGRCYVYGEHDRVDFAYIPEPGTLALLGLGLAGLVANTYRPTGAVVERAVRGAYLRAWHAQ